MTRGRAAWRPTLAWRAAARAGVLLGAWELYVDLGGADPLILPAPHAVAKALYTDRSLLWSNFLVTAREVLLGMALAAIAGLALLDRAALLADAAPRDLSAAGRVADDPDPDARARCWCSGSGSGSSPSSW